MLDRLLGNGQLKADLSAALAARRLPHAILICAADGLGKNFAARAIAADYLWPGGGAGAERVMAGACEEVFCLEPEGAGNLIRVDSVRRIRGHLSETALLAEGRVVLVKNAQRLHPAAANALLKSIEEPPAGVVFILTADSEASILPTIRSRCAVYTLAPLPEAVCLQQLTARGTDPRQAEFLCAVYGGALGSCLAAANEERREELALALQTANAGAEKNAWQLLCLTAPLLQKKDKAPLGRLLQDMQDILGRALAAVPVPGLACDPQNAACMLPAVRTARAELAANGNQKLLCTLLCSRLAGQSPVPDQL